MNTDDKGRNLADAENRRRAQFYNRQPKRSGKSNRELAIDALLQRVVEIWIDDRSFEAGTATYLMQLVEQHMAETDMQFDNQYRSDDNV